MTVLVVSESSVFTGQLLIAYLLQSHPQGLPERVVTVTVSIAQVAASRSPGKVFLVGGGAFCTRPAPESWVCPLLLLGKGWWVRGSQGAGATRSQALLPCPSPRTDAQTLRPPGPCWISMINAAVVTDSVAIPALVSRAF